MSKVADILETLDYGPAPEAVNLANEWLDAHGRTFGFYIDGQWSEADSHFASFSPSTGKEIAQIGQASAAVIDNAVKAAAKAQPKWIALGAAGRTKLIYALARQVQKHARLFAVLE